jgi:hypothetical protein
MVSNKIEIIIKQIHPTSGEALLYMLAFVKNQLGKFK